MPGELREHIVTCYQMWREIDFPRPCDAVTTIFLGPEERLGLDFHGIDGRHHSRDLFCVEGIFQTEPTVTAKRLGLCFGYEFIGPAGVLPLKVPVALVQFHGAKHVIGTPRAASPQARCAKLFAMTLRQQVLVLYLKSSALDTEVIGWSMYDGTGKIKHMSGDADERPYTTGLGAMKDGWRLIQASQLQPHPSGDEFRTSYLKYEFFFEKLAESAATDA